MKLFKFSKLKFFKLKTFRILNITNFWEIPNCKYFDFPKLIIFEIYLIGNFWNYRNWIINKILEFVQFGKPKFASKNCQFWNCSSIRYFALLTILSILIFALRYKSIFSIFISYFINL